MKTRKAHYRHVFTCEVCGYPFIAARSTAKTCSNKCRQRKSRAGRVPFTLPENVTLRDLDMLLLTHGGQMTMF